MSHALTPPAPDQPTAADRRFRRLSWLNLSIVALCAVAPLWLSGVALIGPMLALLGNLMSFFSLRHLLRLRRIERTQRQLDDQARTRRIERLRP